MKTNAYKHSEQSRNILSKVKIDLFHNVTMSLSIRSICVVVTASKVNCAFSLKQLLLPECVLFTLCSNKYQFDHFKLA